MSSVILVVDDSTSVRKMVESALRLMKYAVITATDGQDGFEKLQKSRFDLVILDVNMPRMDGLSFLKTVRQQEKWNNTPILMLTTEGEDEDRERAMKLGANAYMHKPFKPAQLIQRVSRLIGAAR